MNAQRSRRRWVAVAALLLGVLYSVLGPARPAAAANYVPISGSGSTLSQNAISDWTGEVQQLGMVVHYNGVGSSTGRAQFAQGLVDFAASDIPYGVNDGVNNDPPPNRGFAYIPDTATATTFMYNLRIGTQRVTNLRLSGENIAKIFTGVLTRWNDPAIAADNPGLALPAIQIIPVVRSDGSGATLAFTRWMAATESQYWTAYCAQVHRNPCTPVSAYPVLPGSGMVAQAGDLGVSGYVKQSAAVGAIGYVEYPYAAATGFPVAKVLNAAGYYTAPTAGHVGVSLLNAKVNTDPSDPATYLTEDLSDVFTDPDPRTYELSSYSYMIVPTVTSLGFSNAKGFTLGDFGKYLLCQGQGQVTQLGYAPLPINLVEAGADQLQHIPGSQVSPTGFIQSCSGNPTFTTDGTNTLALTDPQPQACDQQGPTQCPGPTGTSTSLSGPSQVGTGDHVTLNAAVTPSTAAGNVEFFDNGRSLGPPVAVANGAAQLLTRVLSPGAHTLTAQFEPTDTNVFALSVSDPLIITAITAGGQEAINVNVPLSEGVFTMTVSDTPVQLSPAVLSVDQGFFESIGQLGPVTISDGRIQSKPGWSVSGQVSDFGSGSNTFSGSFLGWGPGFISENTAHDVALGPVVQPDTDPGLAGGSGLASATATHGVGTTVVGADLDLQIPASTPPGDYSATLTITALQSN